MNKLERLRKLEVKHGACNHHPLGLPVTLATIHGRRNSAKKGVSQCPSCQRNGKPQDSIGDTGFHGPAGHLMESKIANDTQGTEKRARRPLSASNEEDDMVSIWTAEASLSIVAPQRPCVNTVESAARDERASIGNKCLLEVVHDMLEGDLIAAYQGKELSQRRSICSSSGRQPTPLTQADEERFAQIMDKVDGWE